MSFIEPIAPCSLEEYERYELNRVSADEVRIAEMYTLMSRLVGGEKDAIRCSIKVLGISALEGCVYVEFYDENMEPSARVSGDFNPANYLDFREEVKIVNIQKGERADIADSYLRDHFSEIGDYLLSAQKDNELVGSR